MIISIATRRRAAYGIAIIAFLGILVAGYLVAVLKFNIWQVFFSTVLYAVAVAVPTVVGIILFAKDRLQ